MSAEHVGASEGTRHVGEAAADAWGFGFGFLGFFQTRVWMGVLQQEQRGPHSAGGPARQAQQAACRVGRRARVRMRVALQASDKQAPAPLWLHACRAAPADIKRMPARGTGARHSQKWRT